MADREVNVRVNLVPGAAGGMEAAARQQGEVLARAQQSVLGRGPGAVGGAAGALNVAAAAAGGGPGAALSALGGAAGSFGMVGGIVAAGVGILGALGEIAKALQGYVPTLEEVHSRWRRASEDLARIRETGRVEAEQLRLALPGPQLQALEAAQAAGNYAQQVRILQQAGRQAEARLPALEALDLGARRTELEAVLRAGRAAAQADLIEPGTLMRARAIFAEAGQAAPAELTGLSVSASMTDEQIARLGQALETPLLATRRLIAAGQAAGLPGAIPSLRPGAPQFPEGAFRAGRGDILDLHAALQAEAARDPREEARFQALYRLLEEWRAEMRRIGSPLGGVPGAIGP
jgi:hypothetical protein